MAQQIPCDICGNTTADFMVTAIANGDTLGIGIECVSAWAEQLTAAYDAARAAQAAPDPSRDGMPEPAAVAAPVAAQTGREAHPAGSDLSDEQWEESGESGRPWTPEDSGATGSEHTEGEVPETVASDE